MNGIEIIEALARAEKERIRRTTESLGISPPRKQRKSSKGKKKTRLSFEDKLRKRGYDI